MLKSQRSSLTGPGSGARPRRNRAGSSALSVLAGAALMCAGATAAALAAAHSAEATTQVCQPLPTGPSGGPRPVHLSLPPLRLARTALRKLERALGTTPSSSPTPGPVDLCVSLQAVAATAQPGQAATYRIRVWPTGGTVDGVSAQISVTTGRSSPPFRPPAFSYCGAGDGTATCAVGTLQPPQASELQAQADVPATAPAGDTVTLTATVTGTASGAASSGEVTATAAVSVVAAPPTSTQPTPGHSSPGHGKPRSSSSPANLGTGLQPESLPSLSSLGGSVTAGNPSIVFPAITAGPSPAPSAPAHSSKAAHRPYRPSVAANILPLNGGQLGGQVAGLIVLVLGIAGVLVRVSLRKPGGN